MTAKLVREIFQKGWFVTEFAPIQRLFLGIAIQHSEDLNMQTLGVQLAQQVGENAPDDIQQFFRNLKGYPHEHFDVIRKFGRFPGRNAALVTNLCISLSTPDSHCRDASARKKR